MAIEAIPLPATNLGNMYPPSCDCGHHLVTCELRCPCIVTVVLPEIIVLTRPGAEVHGVQLAGTLFGPFPQQGDRVLHSHTLFFRAFETQEPVLGIAPPLAARAEEFQAAILSFSTLSFVFAETGSQ